MMANETGYYLEYSPHFPDPFTCFWEYSCSFARELNDRLPWNGLGPWLRESWEIHYMAFYLNRMDVVNTLVMALFLTILRVFLNFLLFKRLPRWLHIYGQDAEKFPESAWKLLIYSVTWTWAFYICFFSESQYFYNPRSHWENYILGREVKPLEYWLYIVQLGFYTHCVYASVFIEIIRKDFAVMMTHHFLTLGLLGYSLAVRVHPIGILVLFVQDIGDVSLESAKLVNYYKLHDGVEHSSWEMVANVMFANFTFEWILCRLYWFPTKVLYSSGVVSVILYSNGPFYLPFNVMLVFLYGMQVYWFSFIVRLIYRMATGQSKVEDTREYEEDR